MWARDPARCGKVRVTQRGLGGSFSMGFDGKVERGIRVRELFLSVAGYSKK